MKQLNTILKSNDGTTEQVVRATLSVVPFLFDFSAIRTILNSGQVFAGKAEALEQ